MTGIPFFRPEPINVIGSIDIQPFGALISIGVVLGAVLMRRWGARHDLEDHHLRSVFFWVGGFGLVGAHVFDALAYHPEKVAANPLFLLMLGQGISSVGGFMGGVLGFFIYSLRHRLPIGPYADALFWAFIPVFVFGRLGCTMVHDHIGAASEGFFLATHYSQEVISAYGYGWPRGSLEPGLYHNLGLYEFIYVAGLWAALVGLSRWRARPVGVLAPALALAYAPVRFMLDFLRVDSFYDPRYGGLTPAQWVVLVMAVISVYVLLCVWRSPHVGNRGQARVLEVSQGEVERGELAPLPVAI